MSQVLTLPPASGAWREGDDPGRRQWVTLPAPRAASSSALGAAPSRRATSTPSGPRSTTSAPSTPASHASPPPLTATRTVVAPAPDSRSAATRPAATIRP